MSLPPSWELCLEMSQPNPCLSITCSPFFGQKTYLTFSGFSLFLVRVLKIFKHTLDCRLKFKSLLSPVRTLPTKTIFLVVSDLMFTELFHVNENNFSWRDSEKSHFIFHREKSTCQKLVRSKDKEDFQTIWSSTEVQQAYHIHSAGYCLVVVFFLWGLTYFRLDPESKTVGEMKFAEPRDFNMNKTNSLKK